MPSNQCDSSDSSDICDSCDSSDGSDSSDRSVTEVTEKKNFFSSHFCFIFYIFFLQKKMLSKKNIKKNHFVVKIKISNCAKTQELKL